MKPDVDQVLQTSAAQLMANLAPELSSTYALGSASLLSLMMALSARQVDRAAEIRVLENRDIRALFGALAPRIEDETLKARIIEASQGRDESVVVSALDESNGALRKLLIELHAHVDELAGGRDAERQIWEVLKRSAERRLLRLG